jgi:hypothetical protein
MSRLNPFMIERFNQFTAEGQELMSQVVTEAHWVSINKMVLEALMREEHPRHGGGAVLRTFDVQLLTSAPIPGDIIQWEYDSWEEVELDTDSMAGWVIKVDGLSSESTGKRIRNKAEVNASADGMGMQPSGWNPDNFPPQPANFALGPIPTLPRVTTCEIRSTLDGDVSYWVDVQLMPDGQCEPP